MSDNQTPQIPKTVKGVIIRANAETNTYDITVDVCEFYRGAFWNDLFYVWLLQRVKDDTIRIAFATTQSLAASAEMYITFLNAIRLCPAKTICKLDHMHEGVSAWAALCCDEIEVSDFGMLQFQPITNRDGKTTDLDAQTRAVADFIFFLYVQAIDRGWMEETEMNALSEGSVVFITPATLRSRCS